MAIFEDVNGNAQVASTDGHGTSSSWSHDSAGKHTDNHFNTMQNVSDDGHGHRTETFTKVTEVVTHDAKTHQVHTDSVSQSVTKELAPGQAAVDLSKVLDEHSNGSTIPGLSYRNEHQQFTATESGHALGGKAEVVIWDKVGNQSSYGGGSRSIDNSRSGAEEWASLSSGVSRSSMSGGLSDKGSMSHPQGAVMDIHAEGENHSHSVGASVANGHAISGDMGFSGSSSSMGRSLDSGMSVTTTAGLGSGSHYGSSVSQSGVSHSDSIGSSVSHGHSDSSSVGGASATHESGTSQNVQHSSQHSDGLSAHVSDSLVNHLVSHGYSAQEAHQTVQGVSHTLGQEVNGHAMGKTGSVEFHKEGPVAVSLSSENTASNGNTISVAMDTLKAVHESGLSQNLDVAQGYKNAHQASQAVAELSR